MTLYRILSDEESEKVKRWQAPELGKAATEVANTRQQANPQHPEEEARVHALLGSPALKPGHQKKNGEQLKVRAMNAENAPASRNINRITAFSSASPITGVASAELLQASYDEGYRKGFDEGSAALQHGSIIELKRVINALECALTKQNDEQLENELVAMVLDIARVVIRREMCLNPEHILDVVQIGLEQLPGKAANQTVRLHPVDANIVRENLNEDSTLSVVDDTTLSRGACHITSGSSLLDAGIDDWLNVVANQLDIKDV